MEEQIKISDLMEKSGVKFGTSGARGKVVDLTSEVCYAYTLAFLTHLKLSEQLGGGESVVFGGDLRPSTPDIMKSIEMAILDSGLKPINSGLVPSPAVALLGLKLSAPSIMVTGSHIPDDRNGIKFNTPTGEITKADEEGIKAIEVTLGHGQYSVDSLSTESSEAKEDYIERFVNAFGKNSLESLKVGVYEHTSVGRDIFVTILEELGAEVFRKGRAEKFIPVDTEAIRPEDVAFAHEWIDHQAMDAIISSDGDADRPLISDEKGNWLRGDVLGILVSQYLEADAVATPVSSNTALEKCGSFKGIKRTKIGSPYVIAALADLAGEGYAKVAGYEANGGFLTYTSIELQSTNSSLSALPTRDCMLPIISTLVMSKQLGKPISALVEQLPARYTLSDRVKELATEISKRNIDVLMSDKEKAADFVAESGFGIKGTDTTDGFRMTLENEDVIHVRPSGNAPECRCYVESDSIERAESLLQLGLKKIKSFA